MIGRPILYESFGGCGRNGTEKSQNNKSLYTLDTNAIIYYLKDDTSAVTFLNKIFSQNISIYISAVTEIALGGYHTCARKTDGTVLCWGDNFAGQLGDGTTVNRSSPTPVKW